MGSVGVEEERELQSFDSVPNVCISLYRFLLLVQANISRVNFDFVAGFYGFYSYFLVELNAFSALTLLVGRQEGHPACKKLSAGMLAWLSVWSKVQTCIWPS